MNKKSVMTDNPGPQISYEHVGIQWCARLRMPEKKLQAMPAGFGSTQIHAFEDLLISIIHESVRMYGKSLQKRPPVDKLMEELQRQETALETTKEE